MNLKILQIVLLPAFIIATGSGCATYEHQIVAPSDLTAHIGQKDDTVVTRQPLEYRFRTVDNRLVARIFNNTDAAIELIGDRSSAVDPSGQSHPIRGMSIAPHSFAKLILPPPRPRIERSGPSIGIGIGGQFGSRSRHRDTLLDGFPGDRSFDDPSYLTIYDDSAIYWEWDGATEVRLTFVYRSTAGEFSHSFSIARQKM